MTRVWSSAVTSAPRCSAHARGPMVRRSGPTKLSTARQHSVRRWTRPVRLGQDEGSENSPVGGSKRILPVEPSSLLYMIWASTQHYADFDHQVKIFNDHQPLSDMPFEKAIQTVTGVILRGIRLEPEWCGGAPGPHRGRVELSHRPSHPYCILSERMQTTGRGLCCIWLKDCRPLWEGALPR